MQDLIITTIQTSLVWENPSKNIQHFSKLIKNIGETDIIVLPEMFNTGFTMNTGLVFEEMDGESVQWMEQTALEKKSVVIGSLIVKENSNFFNRLIAAFPNGDIHFYDKRHLFRMANEHKHFTPGSKKLVINYKGWNICPLVCYDLRFPVWSRNISNEIDIYIYIANWPKARVSAWSKLLRARAIENLSYVVGVNRIGTDGKEIEYNGGSAVIDFKGDDLFEHPFDEEGVHSETLSKVNLFDFREKFAAHLDADQFEILE